MGALSDPSFYPDPPGRVEVRETHISWVFLTGSRVYKVKKPVQLPFLDYGTLERRRAFCHEEVRLNRRLAKATYLGVRSIGWRDGRLALGSANDADAVEFAVEMRRFPEERTLARMLARGAATPVALKAIGARLGKFHRGADRVDLRPAEALAAFERILEENFDTLRDVSVNVVESGDVLAAARFSSAFLAARRDDLLARARRGCWRDGHGDLRAEHVVVDREIEIVDCIEFDPALRRIDAAFDLAFLTMEVEAMGGRQLAEALAAGYLAAGGDPGEEALLSFYAAQRAWIRAKVALIRARQLAALGDDPSTAPEGGRLFDLGRRLAWRARLPLALVICGAPASGKTHLAAAIADASGLAHINSDVVRKRLAGLTPAERAGPERYTDSFTARTYEELAALASERISHEGGVIVDATYRRSAARRAFADTLIQTGARVLFAECRAPHALLLERARRRAERGKSVSDATDEVAERLGREFEPLDEVDVRSRFVVRTHAPTEDIVRHVENRVDSALFA